LLVWQSSGWGEEPPNTAGVSAPGLGPGVVDSEVVARPHRRRFDPGEAHALHRACGPIRIKVALTSQPEDSSAARRLANCQHIEEGSVYSGVS
jgi:hypothetical protein